MYNNDHRLGCVCASFFLSLSLSFQATNSTVYFTTMLMPLEKLATIIDPLSKEISERSARLPLLLSKSQIFKPHFISTKDALKESATEGTVVSALLASILPDKEPVHNYPSCSIVGNSRGLLQGRQRKREKKLFALHRLVFLEIDNNNKVLPSLCS